jgi:hypothetical protein
VAGETGIATLAAVALMAVFLLATAKEWKTPGTVDTASDDSTHAMSEAH